MKNIDAIEKYLDNELSVEEKASFEMNCQNNPELAKELALYIGIHQNIKTAKLESFENRYELVKSSKSKPPFILNPNRRILLTAASAAAVILLVWFIGLPLLNNTSTELQLAQIETPIPLDQTIRGGTNTPKIISEAKKATDKKDFAKVIDLINTLDSLEQVKALPLRAFAYFKLGKHENSIKDYQQLLVSFNDYPTVLRIKWNLYLSYKKNGDEEQANAIFESLEEKEIIEILKEEDLFNLPKK